MKFTQSNMRKQMWTLGLYGSAFLACLAFIYPLIWVLLGSLKDSSDIYTLGLPDRWQFSNYRSAWTAGPWGRYFLNSLFMGLAAGIGHVVFGSMAGYGLAKFQFPGRGLIFAIVIAILTLDTRVLFVPLFQLTSFLGWMDSYQGLVAPLLVAPFSIFLMRQHISGISDSILEAARIDGANEFQIYIKIVLPLSKPVLVVVFLFSFIDAYNNLLWPLIVVRSTELQPIAMGLASFQGAFYFQPELIFAATVLAILPLILLLFVFKRYFVQGMSIQTDK